MITIPWNAQGGTNATFADASAGIVDIDWGAPPFGIDKIARSDIRVIARANDVPSIRNKTTIVMITNAEILQEREQVLERFVLAYREAVEWMYSDPAALQRYAELANVSKGVARELRDELFPEEMLLPGRIVDGCQNPRKDGAAKKVGMALAFISAAPCSRTLGGKRWLGDKPCQGRQPPEAGAAGPPLQGLPPSHTRPPRSTADPRDAASSAIYARIHAAGNKNHRSEFYRQRCGSSALS